MNDLEKENELFNEQNQAYIKTNNRYHDTICEQKELIDTLKDKSSSGGKREKGAWSDNQLDSLRKLYEECRLENTKDIKSKVFKEAAQKCKNSRKVPKAIFESDLLDNTSLNRKAVSNILEIWDFNHSEMYDIDEIQDSYLVYCRY